MWRLAERRTLAVQHCFARYEWMTNDSSSQAGIRDGRRMRSETSWE